MQRRAFLATIVFAPVFAALVAGCGRSAPALPKLDPDATVLAFGDSLTYGTGASPEESYPAVLAQMIARRVVRDGVPGETSAAGLARLGASLDENQPRLLILCLGGNDLLQRLDETTTVSNLRAMIRLAADRGIGVVLVAPPRPALMASAPAYYAALAKEFRIPLEADVLPRVLADRALKSDIVHPNAKGYREVATAIAKLLRDARAL